MVPYTIALDDAAAAFYQRISVALDRPVEMVLADALFQLAGELALEAIQNTK